MSTSGKICHEFDWLPTETEKLITLVKDCDLLWNEESEFYGRESQENAVFNEIGFALNKEPTDCSKKWLNLRNMYAEYSKQAAKLENQEEEDIAWNYYYDALSFLRDSLLSASDESNVAKTDLNTSDTVWPPNDIEKLIDLVRTNEWLWNPLNELYHFKSKQYAAFQLLAEKLNKSAVDCMLKWEKLYLQLRTMENSQNQVTSNWRYYESLKFMISPDVKGKNAKYNVLLDDAAQVFGNFVAESLRELKSEMAAESVKVKIQKLLLESRLFDDFAVGPFRCRTCGAIVDKSLHAKDLFTQSPSKLLHQIKYLTGMWLEACNDTLPQYICESCQAIIKEAFIFRKRCLIVQQKLKETHFKEGIVIEPLPMATSSKEQSHVERARRSENQSEPKCNKSKKSSKPKREMSACKRIRRRLGYKEPEAFVCENCGSRFASKANLTVHLLRHTGVKEFECQACHKRFYTAALLHSHERSHASPFPCSFCGKTFATNVYRKTHERIHTNETPYPCRICDKSFRSFNMRKVHELRHTVKDKRFRNN